MYYEVTTPAAAIAVTLTDAKDFLRLTDSSQDNLLQTILIPALTEVVEDMMGKSFITKTIKVYYDGFPKIDTDSIVLPLTPVQSVVWVKYQATDGTEKTVSSSNYIVQDKANPAKISLKENYTYPSDCKEQSNSVNISCIVGTGSTAASVPGHHKLHLLFMLSHAWANRGLITDKSANEISITLKNILEPYKVINL